MDPEIVTLSCQPLAVYVYMQVCDNKHRNMFTCSALLCEDVFRHGDFGRRGSGADRGVEDAAHPDDQTDDRLFVERRLESKLHG